MGKAVNLKCYFLLENHFFKQSSILCFFFFFKNTKTIKRSPSPPRVSDRCRCLTAAPLFRGGKYLTIGHSAWVRWKRTGDWFTLRRAPSRLERNVWEAGRREGESRELQQLPVRSVPADSAGKSHMHMNTHTRRAEMWLLMRGIQRARVGFLPVSGMMGEDRRGVVLAMPAGWVTALLCVLSSVCAVEGKCAETGQWGWTKGLDNSCTPRLGCQRTWCR